MPNCLVEIVRTVISPILPNLQLVATLHGCSAAICDKIKQSAEGTIQAVIEFVTKRGRELTETDVSRYTQAQQRN